MGKKRMMVPKNITEKAGIISESLFDMIKFKLILSKKVIFVILFLIPFLFVFKNYFTGKELVWGDAPYFWLDSFSELVKEPYSWTMRGNGLGQINKFLWIWPVMILYGALHAGFGFENGIIIRILFYFPSIIYTF